MFFGEDAGGEGFYRVGVEYGNRRLEEDGTAIEIFIDKMNGATGDFDAMRERLVLSIEAGEGG
jgi:hypothetical protein